MEINIVGRNMDVGDALSERIEDEMDATIARYFESAIEGTATLTRQQKRFTAALRAHIARGVTVESSASAADAHSAFDVALERMAKQLRRYKRKLVAAHHHQAASTGVAAEMIQAADYVVEDDPDSEEAALGHGDEPVIVAETTMIIPSLSVSEAVMRMDLSGRPALFFRHAGTGRLNAIYRRDDGNVGWIDPAETA